MKWKLVSGKQYERQIIQKFAFFPIRINGEVRWLEWVNIKAYYWIGFLTGNIYWEYEAFVD